MEGNLRFKIDWASITVGSKFTVFALFYFVFEGNFQVQAPRGAYIWRGDLTEGFLRYRFGGLIFGGAYTWRGLFSEFYGIGHVASVFVLLCLAEGGHFSADDCFTQKSRSPSTRSAAHLHISLHISHETA